MLRERPGRFSRIRHPKRGGGPPLHKWVEERHRRRGTAAPPDRRGDNGVWSCEDLVRPRATSISHQASRIEPPDSAMPVSPVQIDKAEVIWKRYQRGNMRRQRAVPLFIPSDGVGRSAASASRRGVCPTSACWRPNDPIEQIGVGASSGLRASNCTVLTDRGPFVRKNRRSGRFPVCRDATSKQQALARISVVASPIPGVVPHHSDYPHRAPHGHHVVVRLAMIQLTQ